MSKGVHAQGALELCQREPESRESSGMFALGRTSPRVLSTAISSSLLVGEVPIPPGLVSVTTRNLPPHSPCLEDTWLVGRPDVVEPISRVVGPPVGNFTDLVPP